ncbi:MAG: LysR family transcriptional regulator [Akkermansiaceae bacterium]
MNRQQQPKINLQDLHILHLIHHHQSITAAAKAIQLTQSALSKKLQSIEQDLGIQLFHRTTRTLSTTPAGKQLLKDTAPIPNILNSALQRISEEFLHTQKKINIGVSHSLSLAHLPGIFQPQSIQHPDVKTIISQLTRKDLINKISTNQLDLGILTHQHKLKSTVQIHHQMLDTFCIILPANKSAPSLKIKHFQQWVHQQSWILPPLNSPSRIIIDQWLNHKNIQLSPTMELENFDLMCQLTALNMGISFIPKRALTAFPRKRQLQHLTLETPPARTLSVIGPKNTIVADHIKTFTKSILFS